MIIRQARPSHPQIRALLEAHLADMKMHSPPGSVHALDLSGLQSSEISFLSAWDGEILLGCGALKMLDGCHGELKSMRTVGAHLRKGVASNLLAALMTLARKKGLRRLSLETGTPEAFKPARAFYARHGFVPCPAFGDYPADDPFSTFMSRSI